MVEGRQLADGTTVYVIEPEVDAEVRLSGAELAELDAGVAEAESGETISETELFERLRPYR